MKKGVMFSLPIALMSALPVMAAETTGTANAAVVDAMQKTANDMLATGNAVVPIALTVVGLSLVITYGIRLFRKSARP